VGETGGRGRQRDLQREPQEVDGGCGAGGKPDRSGVGEVEWTRRGLLGSGAAALLGLGAAGCAPGAGPLDGGGIPSGGASPRSGGPAAAAADRVLVLVVMGGGNDGLNTVIPYNQGPYYDGRPTIAIPQKQVLPLASGLGLHPSLKGLQGVFQAGGLSIVQGVGYPQPVLSHFRSMAIWQTAQPETDGTTGWLGRYLDQTASSADDPLRAVAIGPTVPLVMVGRRTSVPAISSVPAFDLRGDPRFAADLGPLRSALAAMYQAAPAEPTFGLLRGDVTVAYAAASEVQQAARGYTPGPGVQYPSFGFASDLQMVVRLLAGGIKTQLFTVGLGGFDDHANERAPYAALLQNFGDSLAAFQTDLQAHGLADRVLTVTFSEFGRRVKENASGGTDHGTAGPMFVMGSAVRGGLDGEAPKLASLDSTGDLRYGIDFRSVFGTVLEQWLDGPARAVVGEGFGGLNLFKKA